MECFVSQIVCLATHITPKGFMKCEGQTLETADYPALFSVIGITYGGNGTTNFQLPDLRDRSIVHQSETKVLGSSGGSSSVELIEENLPEHNHELGTLKVVLKVSDNPTAEYSPNGKYLGVGAATNRDYVTSLSGEGELNGIEIFGEIANAGSGTSVDIQTPYLAMNYFISLYGVLPVSE